MNAARIDLLALGLDSGFASIIDGTPKNTWATRTDLLRTTRTSDILKIADNLFPKDGSFFRPSQLDLICVVFPVCQDTVARGKWVC